MKKNEAFGSFPLQHLAQFLEEHPSFSPQASGEDTVIDGFQVGDCFFTVDDMEWLFAGPTDWRIPRLLAVCDAPVYEA
jgi:hypothetical protein